MKGNSSDFHVAIRPGKRRALLDTPEWRLDDLSEIDKVYIHAKGEHPFRVIFVQSARDHSGSSAFRRPACPACSYLGLGLIQSQSQRMRRGVRFPAWYLLLVAVLGILSGCQSLRDLERFAIRHHTVLTEALGVELRRPPSDSSFRYFFQQVDVSALYTAIRD